MPNPTWTIGRAGHLPGAQEERDRHREHADACVERVVALNHLQIEGNREEDPHQDHVLGQ
jgi:hypothetical protein